MNNHIGSSFDKYLEEEGILSEVIKMSQKEIITIQIRQAMNNLKVTKTQMAKKMKTSRSAIDRLLNPANTNVTLDSLERAAEALGLNLTISIQ